MDHEQAERPREARAQERRRRLLDSARKLFVEQGFHQTGMAQIAAVSGVKTQQIYRDFAGKAQIIASICEIDAVEWLAEDVLQAALDAGDKAAVRDWILNVVRIDDDLEQNRMIAEIVAEGSRNPEVGEINKRLEDKILSRMEAAIEALAPGPSKTARRRAAAGMFLTLSMGMMMRAALNMSLDPAQMTRDVHALVDRELNQLTS
ncbi:MAG: helix-turn-helix domain-containing protein [Caulobacter sp.]